MNYNNFEECRVFFKPTDGERNCTEHPKSANRLGALMVAEITRLRTTLSTINDLSYATEEDGRTSWRDLCRRFCDMARRAITTEFFRKSSPFIGPSSYTPMIAAAPDL